MKVERVYDPLPAKPIERKVNGVLTDRAVSFEGDKNEKEKNSQEFSAKEEKKPDEKSLIAEVAKANEAASIQSSIDIVA